MVTQSNASSSLFKIQGQQAIYIIIYLGYDVAVPITQSITAKVVHRIWIETTKLVCNAISNSSSLLFYFQLIYYLSGI